MDNVTNFEDAVAQTQAMFEQPEEQPAQEAQEEPVQAGQPVEQPPEQAQPEIDPVEEQSSELQQMQQQLAASQQQMDAIMQQNAQLQSMVNELSNANKEHIVEETIEMPTIDFNGLAFADEDAARDAQIKYAQDMQEYVRQSILKDLQPYIDEAKRGEAARHEQEIIAGLREVPGVDDLDDMLPDMRSIMQRNPILSREDIPVDDRMILAYGLAKGIRGMNAPKEQSVDDLMAIYDSNPEFKAAVEKKRLEAVKDGMQVPPLSASSGAANAALQIKDVPKNFEDAKDRIRDMFRE